MPLDDELIRAINETVTEMRQPETVSRKIVAWLESMSEGGLTSSEMETFLARTLDSINSQYGGADDN